MMQAISQMGGMALGLMALGITLALLVLRVHIGVTMLVGGMACYWAVNAGDWRALLFTLNNLAYSRLSNYDLAVVPLFVLMGQFATHGGLSKIIFRCAAAWIGHLRGGIGISAIGACAGFGAICGSSLATSATMSHVALPELRRHQYPGNLATATVAIGGTLGILIPPSVPLIIYAVLTQESISKLFVAAIIPGVLAIAGYMLVMWLIVMRQGIRSVAGSAPWSERVKSLVLVSPMIGVFLVVVVGIYGGWANPTEAAAIGASACGILAVIQGGLRWPGLRQSLLGTAQTGAAGGGFAQFWYGLDPDASRACDLGEAIGPAPHIDCQCHFAAVYFVGLRYGFASHAAADYSNFLPSHHGVGYLWFE